MDQNENRTLSGRGSRRKGILALNIQSLQLASHKKMSVPLKELKNQLSNAKMKHILVEYGSQRSRKGFNRPNPFV